MAVWQYDLTMSPSGETQVLQVCEELDHRFKELDSWSEEVRTWGSMDGNRIDYLKDDGSELFRVRIDLREPSVDFMKTVLVLANRWSMTLEDDDGNELRPNLEDLVSNLKSSDAYRFVTNPKKFLDEIAKK
jgi:hypothetical protein